MYRLITRKEQGGWGEGQYGDVDRIITAVHSLFFKLFLVNIIVPFEDSVLLQRNF